VGGVEKSVQAPSFGRRGLGCCAVQAAQLLVEPGKYTMGLLRLWCSPPCTHNGI